MDEPTKHLLYGCAVSTFVLCILINMGGLSLWLPHWLVVTLVIVSGFGFLRLHERHMGWVLWFALIGCIGGIKVSSDAAETRRHNERVGKPAVALPDLKHLPTGTLVRLEDAQIPMEYRTTHSVSNGYYRYVIPLVDAAWQASNGRVTAWLKLRASSSNPKPDQAMELIEMEESYQNVVDEACKTHKLKCDDQPRLLRPLHTSSTSMSILINSVYMSAVFGGLGIAFLVLAKVTVVVQSWLE